MGRYRFLTPADIKRSMIILSIIYAPIVWQMYVGTVLVVGDYLVSPVTTESSVEKSFKNP